MYLITISDSKLDTLKRIVTIREIEETPTEITESEALIESSPEHNPPEVKYDSVLCYNPETNEAYYRYTKSDALIGGEAITALTAEAIVFSGGDAAKSREVAAAIAEAAPMLTARPWAVGMTTQPGDIVSNPDGKYNYVYSGIAAKTHSNPLSTSRIRELYVYGRQRLFPLFRSTA